MGTTISILRVKRVLDSLLKYVQEDWQLYFDDGNEEGSFLYRVLSGNVEEDYDFYEQGKAIFLRKGTSPRKLETRLMFSRDISPIPTIHVREPSKSNGDYNSIGGLTNSFNLVERGDLSGSFLEGEYRDTKKATYELMVTSGNTFETILVAEVVYSLLLGAYETLSSEVLLDTFSFGMKELMAKNDLVPYPVYIKSIELYTQFENVVPSISKEPLLSQVIFEKPTVYEK